MIQDVVYPSVLHRQHLFVWCHLSVRLSGPVEVALEAQVPLVWAEVVELEVRLGPGGLVLLHLK